MHAILGWLGSDGWLTNQPLSILAPALNPFAALAYLFHRNTRAIGNAAHRSSVRAAERLCIARPPGRQGCDLSQYKVWCASHWADRAAGRTPAPEAYSDHVGRIVILGGLKGQLADTGFELPHWLGPGGTRRRSSWRLGAGRASRFRFTRRPCVFLFDVRLQDSRLTGRTRLHLWRRGG